MKNPITKVSILATAVIALAVFGFVFAAFPQAASAYYYDYSTCPYPTVYSNGYYTCNHMPTSYTPPPVYTQPPVYTPPPTYYPPVYQPIIASCYATNSSVPTGSTVQWIATVSGGTGSYSYTWTGSDNLLGYGQSVSTNYYNPGVKTANVTVTSGGQQSSVTCSNSVNVYSYQASYPNYYSNYSNVNYATYPTYVSQTVPYVNSTNVINTNASGLDIGCYADPASVSVNQPVTWNAEVTGGMAPYKVNWSGSDGLTGESNTAIKYYQSAGSKSALVTVTSADGRTGTRACSNAVTVRGSGYVAPQPPVQIQPKPADTVNNQNLGAAALFSLSGIPWGWVAVLVILILFATVMYLLFNKPKI